MPATVCEFCGDEFEAKRPSARFCGDACRQRAHRSAQEPAGGDGQPGPVELSVRADLARYGASGTSRGEIAVSLARAMDKARHGQGALARELLQLLHSIEFSRRR